MLVGFFSQKRKYILCARSHSIINLLSSEGNIKRIKITQLIQYHQDMYFFKLNRQKTGNNTISEPGCIFQQNTPFTSHHQSHYKTQPNTYPVLCFFSTFAAAAEPGGYDTTSGP